MRVSGVTFFSYKTFAGRFSLLLAAIGICLFVLLGILLLQVEQIKEMSLKVETMQIADKASQQQFREELSHMESKADASLGIGLVGGFLSLLLLMAGGYWIVTSFRKSLQRSSILLERLVQGEAADPMPVTGDEIGTIIGAANQLSLHMQKASDFAQHIGDGDVDFPFEPIGERDVLGISLLHMRDKLNSINEEDKKRNWSTEGLAKFAVIMRQSEGYEALTSIIIAELVKYTKSNQGGIFIVNRDSEKDVHLQLMACYAYERKKFLEKRIEIGEGLLGQCYLEADTIYMEDIPDAYIHITSGLGEANPSSLLIVPLKVNDLVEGVIELASFHRMAPYEIEFVEKVGEIIASEISKTRITESTKILLQASQKQAQELRSKEEEMRQNMEEVQATQEELQRQTAEMKEVQKKLEVEKAMFHVLMDHLPDRITYKDKDSVITRVNKAKADRMKMAAEEFLGKTDYDFFDKEHASKAMREEKAMLEAGVPLLNVEERMVFKDTGSVAWASSSRIPFKNNVGEIIGMLIFTKDITEMKKTATSLMDTQEMMEYLLNLLPVFRYTLTPEAQVEDLTESKALGDMTLNTLAIAQSLGIGKEKLESHEENILVTKGDVGGQGPTFKHFLFKDHNRPGFYKGIAIREDNVAVHGHERV